MNRLVTVGIALILVASQPVLAQVLSKESVVELAEKFIAENGYTDLPRESAKASLDRESLEWTSDRESMLQQRANTLKPKAIGAKKGRRGNKSGWSVAFDYAASSPTNPETCRVVTMNEDGSDTRVEHVDGIRRVFVGFNE